MDKCKLRTFSVRNKNGNVTEKLVTSSEFGRWLTNVVTPDVYYPLLFLDGKEGPSYHPGTRIGNFFSDAKNAFISSKYYSIYIPTDTETFQNLKKLPLFRNKDISTNCKIGGKKRVVRTFTLEQVEMFLNSTMNRQFNIKDWLGRNYVINLTMSDEKNYICLYPCKKQNLTQKPKEQDLVKRMTVKQIQDKLGFKVAIVEEETK